MHEAGLSREEGSYSWLCFHRLKSATTNEESLRGSGGMPSRHTSIICWSYSKQRSSINVRLAFQDWQLRREIEFVIKMTRIAGTFNQWGKEDAHEEPKLREKRVFRCDIIGLAMHEVQNTKNRRDLFCGMRATWSSVMISKDYQVSIQILPINQCLPIFSFKNFKQF